MNKNVENIFPVFDRMISRKVREEKLDQKGCVLWLTGLSGAGKTTLALAFERKMYEDGKLVKILDGDNIRSGLNGDLDFTAAGRKENIRRISEVAKLFADTGIITVCCFVSPTKELRELAKSITGPADFHEIYIKASLETCENRDVKGLYKKSRAGEVKNFTGVSDGFEAPENPDLIIETDKNNIEICLSKLENYYNNILKAV